MAKYKKDRQWNFEEVDSLMDAIFDEAKKQFGDNLYTGSEADQLVLGLPLPALCLRYLFQSTIFPLSRMTVITGQEGSCKSAFLYEIFRWHRLLGGRNLLLECETKDSPDLRMSILNYDQKACMVKPCDTLEEWQQALSWFVEKNKKLMVGTKDNPGPGAIIPFCIGIDSLMAKTSEENIKKIDKDGFAGRNHPVDALKISQFMKVWPQKLFKWPFSVVATNHLKPTTDFMGRPGRNIPGGMAPKFQETYELEMARIGDIKRADYEGVNLSITTRKNSLGPSRKQIKASLVWWFDVEEVTDSETGETKPITVQRTMWNWHSASMELLVEIQSKDKTRWKAISEFLDLEVERSKGNMIHSEALGMGSDEKVPFSKAGEMLENRPDILHKLYSILGIRDRAEFKPGYDFSRQVEEAQLSKIDPTPSPVESESELNNFDIAADMEE